MLTFVTFSVGVTHYSSQFSGICCSTINALKSVMSGFPSLVLRVRRILPTDFFAKGTVSLLFSLKVRSSDKIIYYFTLLFRATLMFTCVIYCVSYNFLTASIAKGLKLTSIAHYVITIKPLEDDLHWLTVSLFLL